MLIDRTMNVVGKIWEYLCKSRWTCGSNSGGTTFFFLGCPTRDTQDGLHLQFERFTWGGVPPPVSIAYLGNESATIYPDTLSRMMTWYLFVFSFYFWLELGGALVKVLRSSFSISEAGVLARFSFSELQKTWLPSPFLPSQLISLAFSKFFLFPNFFFVFSLTRVPCTALVMLCVN